MIKNPVIRALLATTYIAGISTFISSMETLASGPDTVFIPMAMLSLFVLSAALMGYLFLGEPIQLYLDGKKAEATEMFFKTVISFAVITLIFFALAVLFSSGPYSL